jgi:hypothetical protein
MVITYADIAATLALLLAAAAIVLVIFDPFHMLAPSAPAPAPAPSGEVGKVKGKAANVPLVKRIKFVALEPVEGQEILDMEGMKLVATCAVTEVGKNTYTATVQVDVVSAEQAVANTGFITDDGNSESPHVRGAAIAPEGTFSLFQGDGPPFVSATGGTADQAEGQLVYNTVKRTITVTYHTYVQTRPDGGSCEYFGTAVSEK